LLLQKARITTLNKRADRVETSYNVTECVKAFSVAYTSSFARGQQSIL